MDDLMATTKKEELDRALDAAAPNVGIAFGIELYDAFRVRGWFTLERFSGLSGLTSFGQVVPAYRRTHYVFPSWGIADTEFAVGKSA